MQWAASTREMRASETQSLFQPPTIPLLLKQGDPSDATFPSWTQWSRGRLGWSGKEKAVLEICNDRGFWSREPIRLLKHVTHQTRWRTSKKPTHHKGLQDVPKRPYSHLPNCSPPKRALPWSPQGMACYVWQSVPLGGATDFHIHTIFFHFSRKNWIFLRSKYWHNCQSMLHETSFLVYHVCC